MKNKKGVVHAGAIIAIVAILGVTAAGVGYVVYKNNVPSVKVGPNGVQVNTDGLNVTAGDGGVNVDMDGLSVQTGTNGANVDMDGLSVQTGNDGVNVNIGGGDGTTQEMGTGTNTVLIFDASGSMAAQAEGGSRINIAKKAVSDYVNNLKDDVNLSVVAYGHKGDNTQAGKAASCAGIEEIYYMGPVNDGVVVGKVNALNPNGWTPITNSLKKAQSILNRSSATGQKHIVLLSDGEETCGGDPIAYAKQLCDAGIVVDVIGLDVDGIAETQLNSISVGGCGEYYAVGSADDFSVVVGKMGVKVNTGDVKVEVGENGARVQTGNVDIQANNDGAKVDAGNVHVDTTGGSPVVDVPGVSIPSF